MELIFKISIKMPQITVKRISEYSNKLRNIKLFMDGQEIYKIQSSETPGLENTSLFPLRISTSANSAQV